MEILLDYSTPFNLDATLCCGQAFRWDKHGEWWYGVVMNEVLKVRQITTGLEFDYADADFVRAYLGLKDDLPRIYSRITKDKHVEKAVEMLKGLRILQQDPWECLISYICATYKNVAAIKQMIYQLCKKFGEKHQLEGLNFYRFPMPERLVKASVSELRKCGLGYRAEYVQATARIVYANDFDFECLKNSSYSKARTELQYFPGVGLKVADCISLFSLGMLEAFPVDVRVKRTLLNNYADHFPTVFITKISGEKSLSRLEYEQLHNFGREYFGEYAGYAQEYLYYYERAQ